MIENFTIFGRTFSAYMICALIGILLAGYYATDRAKKNGLNDTDFLVLLLWSAIGIFVGGHLLFGITNIKFFISVLSGIKEYIAEKSLLKYIYYIFSGSVFYGGLIGGLTVGYFYSKKKRMNTPLCLDIMASAIPLFHIFGRIGCFLSGCCYGVEWSHGVTYNYSPVEWANGIPRFPVQLLEASCNLALFIMLSLLLKHKKFKGKLILLYLIFYGIIRFMLEFLRGDDYRGFLFSLSTSQIISIILITFSFIVLIIKYRKNKEKTAV